MDTLKRLIPLHRSANFGDRVDSKATRYRVANGTASTAVTRHSIDVRKKPSAEALNPQA